MYFDYITDNGQLFMDMREESLSKMDNCEKSLLMNSLSPW